MLRAVRSLALVVRDYDEAIAWYVGVPGFRLVEDTPLSGTGGKRWVVVAPDRGSGGGGASLVLARAANEAQAACIGDQTGDGNKWDLIGPAGAAHPRPEVS